MRYDTVQLESNILESNFEPSMKTLSCIISAMIKNSSASKTYLARDTNLNYGRLAMHIIWLEKKGLVESTINKSEVNVCLTNKGRLFSTVISN